MNLETILKPRKIPSACRKCNAELRRSEMERFLDACEKTKVDPFEEAFRHDPPGAFCANCLSITVGEAREKEAEREAIILKAARDVRRHKREKRT